MSKEEIKEFIIESPKHGKFTVLIDAEDWHKVKQHKWNIRKEFKYRKDGKEGKPRWYPSTQIPHPDGGWYTPKPDSRAIRKGWKMSRRRRRKVMSLHQLINNTPKGMVTDHINGNTLDNRKCNLRTCTQMENSQNRCGKGGASSYRGVVWKKPSSPNAKEWAVSVTKYSAADASELSVHCGMYATQEEAAEVYDRALIKYSYEGMLITDRMLNFPHRREEYEREKDTFIINNPKNHRTRIKARRKAFQSKHHEEVKACLAKGMTFKAIAELFTNQGYLTTAGCATWTYAQVVKIAKAYNLMPKYRTPRRRNKDTGFFGVLYVPAGKKYKQDVYLARSHFRLETGERISWCGKGSYKTPELAAAAYNKRAIELYGEDYPFLNDV